MRAKDTVPRRLPGCRRVAQRFDQQRTELSSLLKSALPHRRQRVNSSLDSDVIRSRIWAAMAAVVYQRSSIFALCALFQLPELLCLPVLAHQHSYGLENCPCLELPAYTRVPLVRPRRMVPAATAGSWRSPQELFCIAIVRASQGITTGVGNEHNPLKMPCGSALVGARTCRVKSRAKPTFEFDRFADLPIYSGKTDRQNRTPLSASRLHPWRHLPPRVARPAKLLGSDCLTYLFSEAKNSFRSNEGTGSATHQNGQRRQVKARDSGFPLLKAQDATLEVAP